MAAHPNVSRTYASFRITGRDLDPDEVSTRLGSTPDQSFRRGDKRGSHGTWQHGYWEITSEGEVSSKELEEHIASLLDRLQNAQAAVRELTTEQGVRADMFCFWEAESMNAGVGFSPTLMGRLAAFNLALGLDIYFAL